MFRDWNQHHPIMSMLYGHGSQIKKKEEKMTRNKEKLGLWLCLKNNFGDALMYWILIEKRNLLEKSIF